MHLDPLAFGELDIKELRQQKLKHNQNHQCGLFLQDLNLPELLLNTAQTTHEAMRAAEA